MPKAGKVRKNKVAKLESSRNGKIRRNIIAEAINAR
jgi:hypothetical protein